MSATERTYQTCLPPEAYLRIAKACASKGPRLRSSVYPQASQKVKKPAK
jgi:hypothetical protein